MTRKLLISTALLAALPGLAFAEGEAAPHTGFILTSVLFLLGGILVFWMAAGFAMLEAGLVRSKNVTMQLTKTSRSSRSRRSCIGWRATASCIRVTGWSKAGLARSSP